MSSVRHRDLKGQIACQPEISRIYFWKVGDFGGHQQHLRGWQPDGQTRGELFFQQTMGNLIPTLMYKILSSFTNCFNSVKTRCSFCNKTDISKLI